MKGPNSKCLKMIIFFYKELSKWDEAKLLKCNFSKLEMEQGLKDVKSYMKKINYLDLAKS